MTERVFVNIRGLQTGSEDKPIEAKLQGKYGFINGKHCISYEERPADSELVTKNIIKASGDQVIIIKKNGVESRLVFDQNRITSTDYHTPYGSISLSIRTKSISVKDSQDLIEINLEYSLIYDNSQLSDNLVNIKITPAQ